MSKPYLPHISVFPEPHPSDPAHMVLWKAGNVFTAYDELQRLNTHKNEIASTGTYFQLILTMLLAWSIRRQIAKGRA